MKKAKNQDVTVLSDTLPTNRHAHTHLPAYMHARTTIAAKRLEPAHTHTHTHKHTHTHTRTHTHTHTHNENRKNKNSARKAVKLLRNSKAVLDVFRSVAKCGNVQRGVQWQFVPGALTCSQNCAALPTDHKLTYGGGRVFKSNQCSLC